MIENMSRDQILALLQLALIEIRATDDLEFANKLADVIHNIPGQLKDEVCEAESDAILESIRKRAGRAGLAKYIDKLIDATHKC